MFCKNKNCNKEIGEFAKECPYCGISTSPNQKILLTILIIVFIGIIYYNSKPKKDWNNENINRYTYTKYDPNGYDRDGFDVNGWSKDKLNIKTKTSYDENGYNYKGYDKNGYDIEGYDIKHFDKNGINKDTKTKYNEDGYNKNGFNSSGYNENGYDKNGFNSSGYNENGYDKNGYSLPTEATIKEIVESRGFQIRDMHFTNTDSGGFISRSMGVLKDGKLSSLYVELDKNGKVIVWDQLNIMDIDNTN